MKRIGSVLALLIVASMLGSVAAFGRESKSSAKGPQATVLHNLWWELVGQFINSAPGVTPVTHFHYGYLSWVQGVSAFGASPRTLTTADLTFYADGKTSPLTTNGPLLFATRTGTITIYRDPSRNSDWKHPNTFKDGTRVLVATYRHQPISSSLTGAVSLFSHDRITFTRPFPTAHGMVQLGTVGETFDEHYVGQSNMPGPPSGYFIGYATNE
jgi:hypothetical protein